MVGWFALNVPAALGIYWVVNNIVTTATTMYVRATMPKVEISTGGSASVSSTTMSAQVSDFSNPTSMNERAVGFGGSSDADTMKTITPVDAEILSEEGDDSSLGPDIPPAPKGKVKVGLIILCIRLQKHCSNICIFRLFFSGGRRRRGGTELILK